jgi:hypothetical protein
LKSIPKPYRRDRNYPPAFFALFATFNDKQKARHTPMPAPHLVEAGVAGAAAKSAKLAQLTCIKV